MIEKYHFPEKIFIKNQEIPWEVLSEKVKRKVLLYDENIMQVCVAFKKGGIGEIHQHAHVQMSYVLEGQFEVEINNSNQILNKGDVFYVPSNALHGVKCIDDGMLLDIFNPIREDFL